MTDILPTPRNCPVCDERFMVFVDRKMTMRTKRNLPLYYCMACESFSNPSGFIEDEQILKDSLEWHIKVKDRNITASKTLINEFDRLNVSYKNIVEIGSGIGTFLKVAEMRGSSGIGYDINPLTQPYAREVNNVDVRSENWSYDTDCGPFDMMVCIMVLEHVPEPRSMIRDMARACIRENAAVFISVPFVNRDRWHFIHEPDPKTPNNPFFDNDMHVTHYSTKAMEAVLKEFGMSSVEWIKTGLWHGVLARP